MVKISIHNHRQPHLPPYVVSKFFSEFRDLYNIILLQDLELDLINVSFPPTWTASLLGLELNEERLQQRYGAYAFQPYTTITKHLSCNRCYGLDQWTWAVFSRYSFFPTTAQQAIIQFLVTKDELVECSDQEKTLHSLLTSNSSENSIPTSFAFDNQSYSHSFLRFDGSRNNTFT